MTEYKFTSFEEASDKCKGLLLLQYKAFIVRQLKPDMTTFDDVWFVMVEDEDD